MGIRRQLGRASLPDAQTPQARTALIDAFTPATPDNAVLFDLTVTKTWLRQVIVAMALICHSSYRGSVEFLRDLLGVTISVGTVHDVLRSAHSRLASSTVSKTCPAFG